MESENADNAGILAPLSGFFLAVSMLTRIPVWTKKTDDETVWEWSTAFYPFCGYLIGIPASIPLILTLALYPHVTNLPFLFVSIFFYVTFLEWMTRMFHLDGFCDCCDAFAAMALTKERRLEIMKDPHVGSAALGGTVILLVGKVGMLYLFANFMALEYSGNIVPFVIPFIKKTVLIPLAVIPIAAPFILIPVMSRLTMLFLAAFSQYPREKGTASNIVGKVPVYSLILGIITCYPVFFFLQGSMAFLPCVVLIPALVLFWAAKARAKLGGVTGDVLGACCQTAELAFATAFLLSVKF